MQDSHSQRKNPLRAASSRHKAVVSVLAAITIGLVVSALAWSQDGGKYRKHGPWGAAGGPEMGRFIVRMLDRQVDLDETQTAAIEQIITSTEAEGRVLRAELGSMRKEIADTIQANGYAEDQARITVESYSPQMIDLMMLRIRMMADIHAQLRPEQQAKVKDFMSNVGDPGSRPGPRAHRHGPASPAAPPSAAPAEDL